MVLWRFYKIMILKVKVMSKLCHWCYFFSKLYHCVDICRTLTRSMGLWMDPPPKSQNIVKLPAYHFWHNMLMQFVFRQNNLIRWRFFPSIYQIHMWKSQIHRWKDSFRPGQLMLNTQQSKHIYLSNLLILQMTIFYRQNRILTIIPDSESEAELLFLHYMTE